MSSIFRGVILRVNGELYISELDCFSKEEALASAEHLMHPTNDFAVLGVLEQTLPEFEIHPLLRKAVAGFFQRRE